MNVGLLGGTFDPIHRGHLAVARAAQQRFQLGRILFVPAGSPPHKQKRPLTAYAHRYAMVALATAGEKSFIPSDLESCEQLDGKLSYSIDTIRRLKSQLKQSDRLFFIIGMDAFKDISTWRDPEALLRETEVIVVSRPGFSLGEVGGVLPASLRPLPQVMKTLGHQPASGDIVLRGATLHLLSDVHEQVSATQVRAAARSGRKLDSLCGAEVAEYIRKTALYRHPAGTTAGRKHSSHTNATAMKPRAKR